MNLLKAPSMASKAAELAPAPLGPVGGCERSERLEEIAGSALNHCLCSGRRSESAARIPTGSGDGSGDWRRWGERASTPAYGICKARERDETARVLRIPPGGVARALVGCL